MTGIFQELAGQSIEVEIQDPWMGAQMRNRGKLGDFLSAVRKTGATIVALRLTWNPRNGEDCQESQAEGLRAVAGMHVSGKVNLSPWEPRRGQHFHDRVVHIRSQTTGSSWRVDVTSGIDNLMSYQKECSLFIEKT